VAGRFAPSPTGPLHIGSLVTAIASYLEARKRQTSWFLRIDDLDSPRSAIGATDQILRDLDAHGLHWDGSIQYQSSQLEAYQLAISKLEEAGLIFYCGCSRKDTRGHNYYPGTCRDNKIFRIGYAIRIQTNNVNIEFSDGIRGPCKHSLESLGGDFILRRRDGLISYHLATAIDDGNSKIDHVIRGSDLLNETSKQRYLMELLNLTPPEYAHIPIIADRHGVKLSKRSGAKPVNAVDAVNNWLTASRFLGLSPPLEAHKWGLQEVIHWAKENWKLNSVPKESSLIMDN